jgi:hypothetical protein
LLFWHWPVRLLRRPKLLLLNQLRLKVRSSLGLMRMIRIIMVTTVTTMGVGIMATEADTREEVGIGTTTRMVVMRIAEITVGRIVPGVVVVADASRSRR